MSSNTLPRRSWRLLAAGAVATGVLAGGLALPALRQPALARAAWQVRVVPDELIDWTPGTEPAGYARQQRLPAEVAALAIGDLPADYQRRMERLLDEMALGRSAITAPVDGRRLLPYRGLLTPATLQAVAAIGKLTPPCCSDYTEALTAHGLANGVTVREWQSAEHTMAEFWAPDLAQWIAVDLTANRYWVDDAGRPLSFTQLQQTFERSGEPAFRPISRNLPAAPVEPTPEAAWYARVLPAMGLVAGDDDPQRRSDIARIPLGWPYNQVVGGLVGRQRPVWITARAADRLPASFWQLRLRLRLGVASALLAAAFSLLLAGRWILSTRQAAARHRAPKPAG